MRVTSSSALFPSFSDQVYVLYLKFKNLYDEVLGAAQLRGLEELPWDILYIMPKSWNYVFSDHLPDLTHY